MVRGLAIFAACLVALSVDGVTCSGQQYAPPPPPLTTLPPCPARSDGKPLKKSKQKDCDPSIYPSATEPVKGKKSAAEQTGGAALPSTQAPAQGSSQPAAQQFPFPGEQAVPAPQPPANAFPYPGEGTAGKTPEAEVPHDPAAEKKAADTPAGKAYPFPGGGTPDMPADTDSTAPDRTSDRTPPPAPDSSGSSSSSSSSLPDSSSAPPGSDPGSDSAPGPKGEFDDDENTSSKPKERNGRGRKIQKPQTEDERVDEDLSVAKFYAQSGNSMGAYLRAKDAVKTKPEYAEAHFSLGEAARRLGKKDEASAEYNEYLKLAPDGERAKASIQALEKLH